jgi:hypothetical protein
MLLELCMFFMQKMKNDEQNISIEVSITRLNEILS